MKRKNIKSRKNYRPPRTEVPGDPHPGIPSEANRDKHINFTALERREDDPADLSRDRRERK